MRTKFKLFLTLTLAFIIQFSYSQEKTIKGVVVNDKKDPIYGANIVIKGTKIGTQSDFDGSYTIKCKVGDVLAFTFIGMDELTRKVESATTTVNMTMRSSENNLVEVVVTGQGIKKAKKAIGYAVTTIKAEEFASKPSTDVVRALTGKAPGVNIQQTSGLSGSGTNIIIRGYSSITGSNQPLFVVDGIPFNSDANSDGNFVQGATNASSRFLDLDPNNIESISILKGLSATTLYGSAGRSGVVLVTTKSGKTNKANSKMAINFSQSYYITNISSLPEYQNSYGGGFDNQFGPFFSNWGPAFGTRGTQGIGADGTVIHPYAHYGKDEFPQFFNTDDLGNITAKTVPYKAYDNIKPFFKNGQVTTNSINISGSTDGTSYNMNVGNTSDEGFIENNIYKRLNLSAGGTTKLANGFTISSSLNYVRTDKTAPPTAAGFGSGAAAPSVFADIFYTPRNIDLFNLPYILPSTQGSAYYRTSRDIPNPRWTLKNSSDDEVVRRFFGNFTAVYDINSWSNVSYRLSLDNYTQRKKYYINKGNGQDGDDDGFLQTSVRENTIFDHTFSYNFDTKIGKSGFWNLDGTIGFNPRQSSYYNLTTLSTLQFLYGLIEHGNFTKSETTSFNGNTNIVGLYASTTLGFKKFLYLNIQGRRDSFSSLQPEFRSLFYPSASLSFVPTDAFDYFKGSKVNFLKLRIGYGSSAGFPDPYLTELGISPKPNSFITNDNRIINAIEPTEFRQKANPFLKPELVKEIEFGVEGKFFSNRVGLDLSLYDKRSNDLIIRRPIDPSTGYTFTGDNIASVSNRGIELGLNFAIVKTLTNGFKWDTSIQFTKNKNIVEDLGPVKQVRIAGFTNLGNYAIAGEPYGVILGSQIAKDVNGNYIVGDNGNYAVNNDTSPNNPNRIIGDPNPDWRSTVSNEFGYKNFTISCQLEYQKGGDIYSTTAQTLLSRGNTKDTDYDRSGTVVLPGVNLNGNVNTTQIGITQYGFNNSGFGAREQAVYDGTNIRLREVSLSFNMPKKYLDRTPFGKISLSIVAQNYWFKAINFPKYLNFDTDVQSLGVGNGQGFDYFTGPSAKRIGFNFNLSF